MKHSVYLFLGTDLLECAALTMRNILKHDDESIIRHFSALSWMKTESGGIEVKSMVHHPADEKCFYPDEAYLYQVEAKSLEAISDEEQIKAFFNEWFRTHVTADTQGASDNMQMTIVMQASDNAQKEQALLIAHLLDSPNFKYDVDILLLAPDTYHIFINDEERQKEFSKDIEKLNSQAKNIVTDIIATRSKIDCLKQTVLLQNRKKSGASFDLDQETLVRIISEYAMVCIENYQDIYSKAVSLQGRAEEKIVGIGLSCLNFDRFYFLHYLLHHAYLYIMEREGVQETEVDINKASTLAKETIKDRTRVLTDFYEKYIQPEINKGRKGEDIVPELREYMDEFVEELVKTITAHIQSEDLSLPEKLAVISQILIIDEDSLSGNLFDKNQPAFIDFFREPIHYFIDHYNESLEFEKDENGDVIRNEETGIPVIKNAIITAPQGADGYIQVPIDEIKRLRMEIRQASEYIRSQMKQLEMLEKLREETHKADDVVVDDENHFRRFKLIDKEIEENPLEENYEPKETKETNIDLSHDFTPIKNQGSVGACTTFAVTSVYESILKKNDREDHDLSERFLYYNARENDNRLDKEGVAISTAILSVHGKGICQEKYCLYSETDYNEKPTDDAYKDAENRKIKTAKNIVLGDDQDKNRDALRSAVAEGYPVIISLKLFDAFDHIGSDGMVPIPSPDDKPLQREDNKGASYHAMAICGYDDKNEVFLVRNSWGEDFGKKGYCFIPYAYMCDHQYLNCAYIITEVTDDSIKVRGVKGGYKVMLDLTDVNVKIAIIRNSIAAKKKVQDKLVKAYNAVYAQYETLLQTLSDPSVREEIINESRGFYDHQKNEANRKIREVMAEKSQQLSEFDSQTNKTLIKGWIFVGLSTVALIVLSVLFFYMGIVPAVSAILIGIMAYLLIRYKKKREQERDALEARYDDLHAQRNKVLGEIKTRLEELDYRSFVAGMVLDEMTHLNLRLQSLRNSMRSYINNLSVWHEEEKEKVLEMKPEEKMPFMTLLDNAILSDYFDANCEKLTKDLRLYKCWDGNYEIDEQKIFEFKKGLKQQIKDMLAKSFTDFCVYGYLAGYKQYDFLKKIDKDARPEFIRALSDYSEMLLRPVNSNLKTPSHSVFVKCNKEFTNEWKDLCRKHTKNGNPYCGTISSPYKLLALQLEYLDMENIAIFA